MLEILSYDALSSNRSGRMRSNGSSEQLEQNSNNRSVKKDEKRYFPAAVLARVVRGGFG